VAYYSLKMRISATFFALLPSLLFTAAAEEPHKHAHSHEADLVQNADSHHPAGLDESDVSAVPMCPM